MHSLHHGVWKNVVNLTVCMKSSLCAHFLSEMFLCWWVLEKVLTPILCGMFWGHVSGIHPLQGIPHHIPGRYVKQPAYTTLFKAWRVWDILCICRCLIDVEDVFHYMLLRLGKHF